MGLLFFYYFFLLMLLLHFSSYIVRIIIIFISLSLSLSLSLSHETLHLLTCHTPLHHSSLSDSPLNHHHHHRPFLPTSFLPPSTCQDVCTPFCYNYDTSKTVRTRESHLARASISLLTPQRLRHHLSLTPSFPPSLRHPTSSSLPYSFWTLFLQCISCLFLFFFFFFFFFFVLFLVSLFWNCAILYFLPSFLSSFFPLLLPSFLPWHSGGRPDVIWQI